ncbi:hypothetical protein HDU96_004261, partial [Phlyctochytrium bullatum]
NNIGRKRTALPVGTFQQQGDEQLYRACHNLVQTSARDVGVRILCTLAVTRLLWQGKDFAKHVPSILRGVNNSSNISRSLAKLFDNGTNLDALNKPETAETLFNWPRVVDPEKPFEENVQLVVDYMTLHYRLQYGRNLSISAITDHKGFSRNAKRAEPNIGKKSTAHKRKSDDPHEVSDKDDVDDTSRFRNGIYYPSVAEIIFLRACDLLLELVLRAHVCGVEIEPKMLAETLVRQTYILREPLSKFETALQVACFMTVIDPTLMFTIRKYFYKGWRFDTDALFKALRGGNKPGPAPDIDDFDLKGAVKSMFRHMALSWRKLKGSSASIVPFVVDVNGYKELRLEGMVAKPQKRAKDKKLLD